MPRVYYSKCPIHQADAVLSQANPISTTLYPVLAATKNVRIICLSASVEWATNQPTPLELVVTIDGQTVIYLAVNPVSAGNYTARVRAANAANNQVLDGTVDFESYRAFLQEGRSVKIDARYTGAAGTTLLSCRVKWAKIP